MAAFVIFEAGSQRFAIPAGRVLQVVRAAAPAVVPGAPEIVRGVLDVHGTVVPLLDARVQLGAPPEPVRMSDQLILIDAQPPFALLVDRVADVLEVADARVDRGPGWRAEGTLAEAALRLEDGAVVVHSADRWADLAAAAREAPAK